MDEEETEGSVSFEYNRRAKEHTPAPMPIKTGFWRDYGVKVFFSVLVSVVCLALVLKGATEDRYSGMIFYVPAASFAALIGIVAPFFHFLRHRRICAIVGDEEAEGLVS